VRQAVFAVLVRNQRIKETCTGVKIHSSEKCFALIFGKKRTEEANKICPGVKPSSIVLPTKTNKSCPGVFLSKKKLKSY